MYVQDVVYNKGGFELSYVATYHLNLNLRIEMVILIYYIEMWLLSPSRTIYLDEHKPVMSLSLTFNKMKISSRCAAKL